MHKSKLAGFIIDCQTDNLKQAAQFWSQALGLAEQHYEDPVEEKYIRLIDHHDDLQIEVQSVDHQSRVHLDIETDDIAAEVARLEQLGAHKVKEMERWCVMEAPTGQRFCVIKANSRDFASKANRW